MTEDAIRRRELADLGITAEVESDGHTVVVTLDRPQFDRLTAGLSYEQGWEDATDAVTEFVSNASPKARIA
jgi:hypothetical protein